MYSTTAYLYHQNHQVLIIDSSLTTNLTARYNPVYSKKLTLNRGVDNVILFEFVNQDQKPVNITGSTFTFRAVSQDGTTLLIASDLIPLSLELGRAKLSLSSSALDSITAQPARWSLDRTSGVLNEGVYIDENAASSGLLDIVDAVYPSFVASTTVDVPDQGHNPSDPYDLSTSYTSVINTTDAGLMTIQLTPDSFVGNVFVQGATDMDGSWYTISSAAYTGTEPRNYINVEGFHPLLRLQINNTSGNIVDIKYR